MEDPELCAQPWYAGSCDRQTAETALLYANKDGAYLVRRSGRGGPQPYTLAVLLGARVYNIPVRLIPGPRPFALGRTNTCPELFPSVPSMVWHYTQHPLVLVDGTTCARQHTRLIYPVKP
ncbi:PREDICTED: SH2 domain-containing protein 6 [Crocodylus porosus]|nr:PREDICTED: SH2 domain-containing protein 6 [Crocodylus porosus]